MPHNDQVFNALMATGHWGEIEAALGIEFDFKCAYCGKEMFDSVDSYKEWQTDHIIPASKGGADALTNYALSCRTCNFIKGTWNPALHIDKPVSTKAELIELASKYIASKRSEVEKDLELYNKILRSHCS